MDVQTLVNQILGSLSPQTGQVMTPISTALPTAELNNFTVPNTNDYITKAFNELKPYYAKLLQEAQGDTNLAIKNLQTDYQTGTRFLQENTQTQTSQTVDNLNAALKSLGLTFGKETEAATDSLNKRGMAVTESSPGQNLNVLKDGEGAREMGQLTQDQQLRQEAENRTATQNLTNLGIQARQTQESNSQKLTENTQNTLMDYRNKAEGYQQQAEGQAAQIGGANQNQADTAQSLQLQKDQLAAANGSGTGGKPAMPTQGAYPNVGTMQNGYRWTGTEWAS